jgi:hypothetical protein
VAEGGLLQEGFGKIRLREIGSIEERSARINPTEVHSAQVRPTEIGTS